MITTTLDRIDSAAEKKYDSTPEQQHGEVRETEQRLMKGRSQLLSLKYSLSLFFSLSQLSGVSQHISRTICG